MHAFFDTLSCCVCSLAAGWLVLVWLRQAWASLYRGRPDAALACRDHHTAVKVALGRLPAQQWTRRAVTPPSARRRARSTFGRKLCVSSACCALFACLHARACLRVSVSACLILCARMSVRACACVCGYVFLLMPRPAVPIN